MILRIDGPPEVLVPEALAAAGRAGYRWVVSPWAPEGHGPPEVACQVYEASIARPGTASGGGTTGQGRR